MIQVGDDESAAMKPGQVLHYLDFYSGIFENHEAQCMNIVFEWKFLIEVIMHGGPSTSIAESPTSFTNHILQSRRSTKKKTATGH